MSKIFKDKIDTIILAITIGIFGYFALFLEVTELSDSFQYLRQYPMREPVYSLFLQILQTISAGSYAIILGYMQNLLAIVCIYWSYRVLSDMWEFNRIGRIGVCVLLVAPHIITPLASKTHLVLTNSVLTEGISLSLYYVWITLMMRLIVKDYSSHEYIKENAKIIFLSMVLAMTRGQMVVCFVLWLIVVIAKAVYSKSYKKIIIYLLIVIGCTCLKTQLTKWYNRAETGYYVNTISSKPMLLANIVYISEIEDAQYIDEADLREAYQNIVADAISKKQNFSYSGKGIIAKAKYHEEVHDAINFECIDPEIRIVINNRYGIEESLFWDLMIKEEELCGQIAKELLPHVWARYLKNYFFIAALGFVRTVAIERSGLYLVAILMYMIAAGILLHAIINKRFSYSNIMIFMLINICGTVFGTSLVIQCITRYMIYNLPFFYITIMGYAKYMRKK